MICIKGFVAGDHMNIESAQATAEYNKPFVWIQKRNIYRNTTAPPLPVLYSDNHMRVCILQLRSPWLLWRQNTERWHHTNNCPGPIRTAAISSSIQMAFKYDSSYPYCPRGNARATFSSVTVSTVFALVIGTHFGTKTHTHQRAVITPAWIERFSSTANDWILRYRW